MRKQIVAGNWKMNTTVTEGISLAREIVEKSKELIGVNLIISPPFTHISSISEVLKGSKVGLGAQNCADQENGAYTGEVSSYMLSELDVQYVILGHSERREFYGESSSTLNKKMSLVYKNNLIPIYCVGEKLDERESGNHFNVIKAQIQEVVYNLTEVEFSQLIIAYEPVWAIGTGKTASSDQAQEIHAFIRQILADKFGELSEETSILYGGSCKPSNAKDIFSKKDVDGGLIGGAALSSDDFIAIAKSF